VKKPTTFLGRKAAKATVKHSVRGSVAKAKREPPRTLTLLAVGAVFGVVVGWLLANHRAGSETDPASVNGAPPTNPGA
jgi:hypothetical protein